VLTALEELTVTMTDHAFNVSALTTLTRLRSLRFETVKVDDLELELFTWIQIFTAYKLTSLVSIASMRQLHTLHLKDCCIYDDLIHLKALPDLRVLRLEGISVHEMKDLEHLSGLTTLHELHFTDMYVKNLNMSSVLTNLQSISMHNCVTYDELCPFILSILIVT
jgi:hypothetical protein